MIVGQEMNVFNIKRVQRACASVLFVSTIWRRPLFHTSVLASEELTPSTSWQRTWLRKASHCFLGFSLAAQIESGALFLHPWKVTSWLLKTQVLPFNLSYRKVWRRWTSRSGFSRWIHICRSAAHICTRIFYYNLILSWRSGTGVLA